jgi:hypothetical protein
VWDRRSHRHTAPATTARKHRQDLDGSSAHQPPATYWAWPGEALRYFAEDSLLFKPGSQYRYSSYGGILVSAAVEAAADKPFLTLMREQIFDPMLSEMVGRLPGKIWGSSRRSGIKLTSDQRQFGSCSLRCPPT